MVWATVRCWFCFWWLYRTSPSSAAKNIINLISVLTFWWCLCVELSFHVGMGVCYNQSILLLASVLLHFVLQGQTCLLFHVSLDFLLLHSSPHDEKDIFFLVLVLEGLQVFKDPFSFNFLSINGCGIDLDYFVLNGLPWKWIEIILLLLRLHPRAAFQILLLTMRATPFLLRDSFPQ